MKKGDKVSAELLLMGNRPLKIEGKIKDERSLFGRNEVLVMVKKTDPIWITKDKLNVES